LYLRRIENSQTETPSDNGQSRVCILFSQCLEFAVQLQALSMGVAVGCPCLKPEWLLPVSANARAYHTFC